jgi:hypothetical protein
MGNFEKMLSKIEEDKKDIGECYGDSLAGYMDQFVEIMKCQQDFIRNISSIYPWSSMVLNKVDKIAGEVINGK